MVSRLPCEKDGEIIFIDKLMVGDTVFYKHNFLFMKTEVVCAHWECLCERFPISNTSNGQMVK